MAEFRTFHHFFFVLFLCLEFRLTSSIPSLMSKPTERETKRPALQTSPPEKLSGFEWWRRSIAYATGLGIEEKEARQFEHDYRVKHFPDNCKQCEQFRDYALHYSPSVIFMMGHVRKLGGNLSKKNIFCGKCDDLKGGGFHPNMGILLCSNWIQHQQQMEDVITHELVHAYDYLKFKLDMNDLNHHACTEIRASMLSGECRIMNEILKTGYANFGGKFQDCIRRRAIISVSTNAKCGSPEKAAEYVDKVWNSCFRDTRPFERVYN